MVYPFLPPLPGTSSSQSPYCFSSNQLWACCCYFSLRAYLAHLQSSLPTQKGAALLSCSSWFPYSHIILKSNNNNNNNKHIGSLVCWLASAIPALRRLKQKEWYELRVNLDYRVTQKGKTRQIHQQHNYFWRWRSNPTCEARLLPLSYISDIHLGVGKTARHYVV